MSVGWIVADAARAALLARFPPRYLRTVAHHVTLLGQGESEPLPPPADFAIVGHADDDRGVEAMVVAMDGSTARPDGGVWHVTWSLADGRQAKESNDVIAACRWLVLEGGAIETRPGRWR